MVDMTDTWWKKYLLANIIILLSFGIIILFGLCAVFYSGDREEAITIFHITLPVCATWIGTVLAFYFGRENMDSMNTQVREIITKLNQDEIVQHPISKIMRTYGDMICFSIPPGKNDKDIKMCDICHLISFKITRIPVLNSDKSPRYIIHSSKIESYVLLPENKDKSLEQFISDQKSLGFEFGNNKGFVVIPESASIGDAKKILEQCSKCQDIFITRGGSDKEPLLGWVSNLRLLKFLRL